MKSHLNKIIIALLMLISNEITLLASYPDDICVSGSSEWINLNSFTGRSNIQNVRIMAANTDCGSPVYLTDVAELKYVIATTETYVIQNGEPQVINMSATAIWYVRWLKPGHYKLRLYLAAAGGIWTDVRCETAFVNFSSNNTSTFSLANNYVCTNNPIIQPIRNVTTGPIRHKYIDVYEVDANDNYVSGTYWWSTGWVDENWSNQVYTLPNLPAGKRFCLKYSTDNACTNWIEYKQYFYSIANALANVSFTTPRFKNVAGFNANYFLNCDNNSFKVINSSNSHACSPITSYQFTVINNINNSYVSTNSNSFTPAQMNNLYLNNASILGTNFVNSLKSGSAFGLTLKATNNAGTAEYSRLIYYASLSPSDANFLLGSYIGSNPTIVPRNETDPNSTNTLLGNITANLVIGGVSNSSSITSYKVEVWKNSDSNFTNLVGTKTYITPITNTSLVYLNDVCNNYFQNMTEAQKQNERFKVVFYVTNDCGTVSKYSYFRIIPNCPLGANCLNNDGNDNNSTSRITDNDHVNSIKIFPNPVEDVLNVEIQSKSEASFNYVIFNAEGKQMNINNDKNILMEGLNNISINVQSLKPGIYLLKTTQNNKQESFKFIKH